MDVYAGNRFQTVSPASMAAVSFTLVLVVFVAIEWSRRGVRELRALAVHRRDLVAINITTALTWMATFYALDYLEPAIVNVIGLALGPVITVFAGRLLRRHSMVMATEVVVSVGICALLGALVWVSFSGRSGLGAVTTTDAVLGLVFTLACAVGSAVNIIYMKRLSDAGCDPGSVLAVRFFLMAAVAWVLVAFERNADLPAAFLPGVVVAIIGVGLPIYVLQIGIRHTEPITTSLLISLSPLFALTLQLADGRLEFSFFTLGGVIGVVALVVVGAAVRHRRDSSRLSGSALPVVVEAAGLRPARPPWLNDESEGPSS